MATLKKVKKLHKGTTRNAKYGALGNDMEGEDWALMYGGSHSCYYNIILPRIYRYLPTGNTLELACGFGRWSELLASQSKSYIGVDMTKGYIQRCKKRFSSNKKFTFFQNDGKSLDMIDNNSIDFLFCFESLHGLDIEVIENYISQFDRILSKNGVVFLHHSNMAEYANIRNKQSWTSFKDPTVDAKKVEKIAKKYNLQCISQEKVQSVIIDTSDHNHYSDCYTVIVKKDSVFARKNRVFKNKLYRQEVKKSFLLSYLYAHGLVEYESSRLDSIAYQLYVIKIFKLSEKRINKILNLQIDIRALKKINNYVQKESTFDIVPLFASLLANKNLKKVVVYGAGEMFLRLEKELKKLNIKVLYVVDKKAENGEYTIMDGKYKVKSKNILKKLKHSTPVVIASFSFVDEIVYRLQAVSGLKNKIYDINECLKEE